MSSSTHNPLIARYEKRISEDNANDRVYVRFLHGVATVIEFYEGGHNDKYVKADKMPQEKFEADTRYNHTFQPSSFADFTDAVAETIKYLQIKV